MRSPIDERRYLIPFRATLLPQIFTDVLVIGGGVAGSAAALAATRETLDRDVIVVTKGRFNQSNTAWAQGGIAAVLEADDSVDEHVQDTMVAGGGLCDEPVVRRVAERGPALVQRIIEDGMRVDRDTDGGLRFGKEGGHSRARIVHADGDATGKSLTAYMEQAVRAAPNIRLFEGCFVLDLITLETSPARVVGAVTHHPKYGLQVIWAHATILAAGGAGQVFRETTNPPVATGDALAMAHRAGAEMMDLAFTQFHPTTLYVAGAGRTLISEAVRGEGAALVDRDGHRFMTDYDERGDLAPRDIVSRGILEQMVKTGHSHVFLDVRPMGVDRFETRFPNIASRIRRFDLDPGQQPIPVHPSAHYMIGGVRTDLDGATSLPGLYACGEAACTGLHGANRLASNSLLEGLVFGDAAGLAAGTSCEGEPGPRPFKVVSDIPISGRSELDLADVRSSLRSVMWRHVGIQREGDRLDEVEEMMGFWARYTLDKIFDERPGWEVQNLLTVGAILTRSARWRTESRGTHYRVDFPKPSNELAQHDVWTRGVLEPKVIPAAQPQPQA